MVNQYAYGVSFVLQESEDIVTPDLKYNRTYMGKFNHSNVIFINLSNVVSAFLNDLTIETQISHKGKKEVLYETKKTNIRMAPNSFIDLPIDVNNEKLTKGTYTAHILAISEDQRWEWTEDFDITENEIKKYSVRDVGIEPDNSVNWSLVIASGISFMAFVVMLFFFIRFLRKKSHKKKSRKKKNKKKSHKKKNKKK